MKRKFLNVFFFIFVSFSVSQNSLGANYDTDFSLTCSLRGLYENYLEPLPTDVRLPILLIPYVFIGIAPGQDSYTRIVSLTLAATSGFVASLVMNYIPDESITNTLTCGPFSYAEERLSYLATALVIILPLHGMVVMQGLYYFLELPVAGPIVMEVPAFVFPMDLSPPAAPAA